MTSIQIDRIDGLSSSVAVKGPCRVATTANIALTGLKTVDGVALAVGDRVLVKDQTTASDNGIWIVDTGPWRRSSDFNKNGDVVQGTQVYVIEGADGGRWYAVESADPIVIGTSNIVLVLSDSQAAASRTTVGPRTGSFTRTLNERDKAYITPRDFGAVSGSSDNRNRILDAIDVAADLGIKTVLIDGNFVSDGPLTLEKQVSFAGRGWQDSLRVNTDNTAAGILIAKTSDLSFQNFDLQVHSDNNIINGSGHNGTCITTCDWFVDPALPETVAVKNILLQNMKFTRITGGTGHALAFVSRSRNIHVDHCYFAGASDGQHGDAILTHWGAWSHGVSTHSLPFAGKLGVFTAGRIVRGATSNASAYITKIDDAGTTGTLYLKALSGAFINAETITDGLTGVATTTGPSVTELVQSRFEPGHYSFHPNGIYVTNCKADWTQRLIACSASYDVHVQNFTIDNPVQLVDLPVGDEADTFAHPEDQGRVFSAFSFKGITERLGEGSGANGVTVIDCSGFSTSKQTDTDLAGYANIAYASDSYYGAQRRNRQPYWRAISFDTLKFSGGPKTPPSATPYVRQMYLRNLLGDFSFKSIDALGRDGVLSVSFANIRGIYAFRDCNLYGGVVVQQSDKVLFDNCKVAQPVSTDTNMDLSGDTVTYTTNSTGFVAGATSITLNAASSARFCIGTPISYAGGTCYVAAWVEPGDTVVNVSSIPVTSSGAQSATFGRQSDVTITNSKLTKGRRGISVSGKATAYISGGMVQQMGQYGILAESDGVAYVNGVTFQGNGTDGGSTRNVIIGTGGTIRLKECLFRLSKFATYHVVAATGWRDGSVEDCIFEDTAITDYVTVDTNSGSVFRWHGNVRGDGTRIGQLSWTPSLRINGVAITAQTSTGTYEVNGDEVTLWFNITATTKGAGTGSLTIAGNPVMAAAKEGVGDCYISGGASLSTTPFPRIGVGATVIGLQRHGSTSYTALTDANISDGAVITGYVKYRVN